MFKVCFHGVENREEEKWIVDPIFDKILHSYMKHPASVLQLFHDWLTTECFGSWAEPWHNLHKQRVLPHTLEQAPKSRKYAGPSPVNFVSLLDISLDAEVGAGSLDRASANSECKRPSFGEKDAVPERSSEHDHQGLDTPRESPHLALERL